MRRSPGAMTILRQRLHRRRLPAGGSGKTFPTPTPPRASCWPRSPPAARRTSTSPSEGAGRLRRRPLAQPPAGRAQALLIDFAKLIERNRHELAVLESLDSGKPVAECQTIDLPETINTIRWHAELIDKIYDSTAPVGQAPGARGARADRRRRLRAAVELPAADDGVEDRPGAGRRLLRHRQAGRGDLAHGAPPRRARAGGRRPGRRPQRRDRHRPGGRRAASASIPASTW